jgi:hypothetical protein
MSKAKPNQLEASAIALGEQHAIVVKLEAELAERQRTRDRAAAAVEDACSVEEGEEAQAAFRQAKWQANGTRAELGKAKARLAEMQTAHNEIEREIDLAEIENINKSMFGSLLDRAVELERVATEHLCEIDKLAVRRMALCQKHAHGQKTFNPFDQFRLARAAALQQKPIAELAKAALEILGFGGPAFDWEEKALLPPAEAIVAAAIRGNDSILVAVKAKVAESRAQQKAERAAKVEACWLEVVENMDNEYQVPFRKFWHGLGVQGQADVKERIYQHSKDVRERRTRLREMFTYSGMGIESSETGPNRWLARHAQQLVPALSPADLMRNAHGLSTAHEVQ